MALCVFDEIDGALTCTLCHRAVKARGKVIRKCIACRHMGEQTGATITVACTCPAGKQTTTTHTINACALHGECLPTFQCTAANKQAVREAWHRSDGGSVDVMTCRDCRAGGLGFEPATPPSSPPPPAPAPA